MQFLHLIFVKKLQLQLQATLPPDPHQGRCPLDPHWGPSAAPRPPGPHFSADFSILNCHACCVGGCLLVAYHPRNMLVYRYILNLEKKIQDESGIVCLLVGCLTSQQHASASQGRICSDNLTCCHTEIEVADQTFYLTQSQYADTGLTSPIADPITRIIKKLIMT